jgi:hypothetical protein
MYTFQQAADAARICMQAIVERGNTLILANPTIDTQEAGVTSRENP